jgi:hypothetical protein
MSDWTSVKSAPRDGSDIDIRTAGGFEMRARWEGHGFINAFLGTGPSAPI